MLYTTNFSYSNLLYITYLLYCSKYILCTKNIIVCYYILYVKKSMYSMFLEYMDF